MDINKIREMIEEHEELLRKAADVLNYYYDEKRILEDNHDLFFSRKMMNEAIERLEDTISDCEERLKYLYDEYHNKLHDEFNNTNCDTTTSKVYSEFDNGDTLTSKVRKDVIKSLKERDSNE